MFKSFFMAGFESATGYNERGDWIDQIAATQHDRFVFEDYHRLAELGLLVARDAIRWPLVDKRGRFDFSSVEPFVKASLEHGVQVIWDLYHYGSPEGVDLFSKDFPPRFADYCHAVAKYLKDRLPRPLYFTPVNEPSYFSWAAGHAGVFYPHQKDRGYELKFNLCAAAIQGIDAIRSVCPDARFVNADPVCRVVPPRDRPDLAEAAHQFNEGDVFQSWDILAGKMLPELGGSPQHLDIVGINYYWTNQWEHTIIGVPLDECDDRCWPLRDLVRWVWHRYRQEIVITETSHVLENRGPYMETIADEVEAILDEGIPLRGVCLYPILGMPEWHEPEVWARMGLWDLEPTPDGTLTRSIHEPMLEGLRNAQERLEGLTLESSSNPVGPLRSGRSR